MTDTIESYVQTLSERSDAALVSMLFIETLAEKRAMIRREIASRKYDSNWLSGKIKREINNEK